MPFVFNFTLSTPKHFSMDNAADPPDGDADTQSLKLALTVISIAVFTFLSQTFTGGRLMQKTIRLANLLSAIPKSAMQFAHSPRY